MILFQGVAFHFSSCPLAWQYSFYVCSRMLKKNYTIFISSELEKYKFSIEKMTEIFLQKSSD